MTTGGTARSVAMLAALLVAFAASDAGAQLARLDPPRLVDSGDFVMGGDAAYDPVNGVYLIVLAREGAGTAGSVQGVFVDTSGIPVGPAFLIHDGARANFARAAYGAAISNAGGGHGGFLVTWTEPFTPAVLAKTVAYPNWVDGGLPRVLHAGYNLREMAYAPPSARFVLAWESDAAPHSAWFQSVAPTGAPIGSPVALTSGNAGRPGIIWNAITAIAWHAAREEFGILYAAQSGSAWTLRLARVSAGGALLGTRDLAEIDAEPIAGALAFSPLTGNYVAFWGEPAAGAIEGMEVSGTGDVLARGPLPSSIAAGQNGMALAYSGGSGTFLLLGFGALDTAIDQVRGIELNKHGAPNSAVVDVTGFPLTTNYFAPRAAGRPDAAEWLVTAGHINRYAQIVTTSSRNGGSDLQLHGCSGPDPFAALGGGTCYSGNWLPPGMPIPGAPPPEDPPPPPPPSSGCSTPDPFVALGGGTCYNGNWLPPGMPIPGAPPPQDPPPPPPPSSTSCSTPDPFVALGGGTCYDGNWLPPGMPIPGAPPPEDSPPPTPPPPSSGCATPDPFVALGGGTCYDGNWLPPGMPIPGAPPPPDPPPPPPPSSTGCSTPDPFVALGGGTCFNGNWLPPGMPIPGAPPAGDPPPPPPPPGDCTPPDPFAAMGGGTCYKGNWLPPGMYFPGDGIIGPNPDPAFPPPPQSTNDCATPDPYLDTPGGIGVCVNGVWQLVAGAHAFGRIFLFDGVWMLREDDTGLLYVPLNGMPPAFQVLGMPVYFEGMLRYDILHTFAAPILQVRVLVAR